MQRAEGYTGRGKSVSFKTQCTIVVSLSIWFPFPSKRKHKSDSSCAFPVHKRTRFLLDYGSVCKYNNWLGENISKCISIQFRNSALWKLLI